MNEYKKSEEFGLVQPFCLGKDLQILCDKVASKGEDQFNVRGSDGLIECLRLVDKSLNYLNIVPNIQNEIHGKLEYYDVMYVKRPLVV